MMKHDKEEHPLEQAQWIMELCKKHGVKSINIDGLELSFFPPAPEPVEFPDYEEDKTENEPDIDPPKYDEDYLINNPPEIL